MRGYQCGESICTTFIGAIEFIGMDRQNPMCLIPSTRAARDVDDHIVLLMIMAAEQSCKTIQFGPFIRDGSVLNPACLNLLIAYQDQLFRRSKDAFESWDASVNLGLEGQRTRLHRLLKIMFETEIIPCIGHNGFVTFFMYEILE